jgi:hypothetical protein
MLLAVFEATDEDRKNRDLVWAAFRAAGTTRDKEIAQGLEIEKGQLADQQAMRAHLSFWRVLRYARADLRIAMELGRMLVEMAGGFVVEPGTTIQVQVIPKQMAKAVLPERAERECA